MFGCRGPHEDGPKGVGLHDGRATEGTTNLITCKEVAPPASIARYLQRLCAPVAAWGALVAFAAVFAGCEGRMEGRPLPVSHMFGEVGGSPGQFLYPRALCADPATGQLWVIDKAGRIQRLDPVTGRGSVHFRAPDTALGRPCGITVGPMARSGLGESRPGSVLYVADTHYHRVLIYESPPRDATPGEEPRLLGSFGSYGQGPGEFIYLTDVAVLEDEQGFAIRLYVCEYGGNDRISIWEPSEGSDASASAATGGPGTTWRFVGAFGSQGDSAAPGDIQFDRPQSIAVDRARGRLVVTDACNHRVGVFTLDGALVRWIAPRAVRREDGQDEPGMAYPFGLHLLADGTALVTEYGNHRLRHLDVETGETLGIYGMGGRGPGELLNPWAVTVLDGTVYVLDSGNERIQAFSLPGRWRSMAGGAP